ncbi:hypothetical protein HIM_03130 [Hirsutella minnesotensis 3608]|nr:hypothetical protein HIM_03130 [Hirsutella minnesotensis 3608]
MAPISNLTQRNERGETLLQLAARHGQANAVCCILTKLREKKLEHEKNAKDHRGSTALHEAADNGSLGVLEELLYAGVKVDITDKEGRIPLHRAAIKGNHLAIEPLLDFNSSPHARDNELRIPLHLASIFGRDMVVEVLLARAPQTKDNKDRDSQPPLFYAALHHHRPVAELLRDAGANIEATKYGLTLLHQVLNLGDTEAAAILIDLGAKIEARDKHGRTPLYSAAFSNQGELFRLLLSRRARVNATDGITGGTLLHRAVHDVKSDAVSLLIEAEAAMEEHDRLGQTPLYLAAKSNQLAIAKLLAEAGADKESPDSKRQTLLHRAAREGSVDAANVLCEVGADKEARDVKSRTPLYIAAKDNKKSVFKALLAKGADVRAADSRGRTLFHRAVREGNKQAAEIFGREEKSWPRDEDGVTPLHVAVLHSIELVKALLELEFDEDCEVTCNNGQTALHIAAGRQDDATKIVHLLLHHGANAEVRDLHGQTAMHIAADRGHVNVVDRLIDTDMDLDIPDCNGQTALHLAAANGRPDVVRLLLEAGAETNAMDNLGYCPLLLGMMSGEMETINMLIDKRLPESEEDYLEFLRDFVQNNLYGVMDPNDRRVDDLARKAPTQVTRLCKEWKLPRRDGAELVKLMLYKFVILCDDSTSMHTGTRERINVLKETLHKVTKIALAMDADNSGINIRFLNYDDDMIGSFDNMRTTQEITEKVEKVFKEKRRGSSLGEKLFDKVVDPMIYSKARSRTLDKPVVVLLITDGKADDEGTLKQTIRDCRKFLLDRNLGKGSVLFLLSQVGDDPDASAFLRDIETDAEIKDMVYCLPERLDEMLKSVPDHSSPEGYTVKVNFNQQINVV